MERHIQDCLMHINPFIKEEEVQEVITINDYEILFIFTNGDKIIYDTHDNNFRGVYPEGHELTDEEWNRSFKIRLRKIMNHRSITQDELADRLGVSRITINRYINGHTIPSCLMLRKISLALDYPLDEFFYKEY